MLGDVLYAQGDYVAAREHYQRSLALNQKLGREAEIAIDLRSLGDVLKAQGDYAGAREHYQKSLALFEKLQLKQRVESVRKRLGQLRSEETKMSEQKPSTPPSGDIKVGDISNATGIAIGHGAQATVTQGGASADEIAKAFAAIAQKVSTMPDGPSKTIAQQAVQGLEAEAKKGEKAEEGRVSEWMNFLAQTASDAFDVAVATFANPIAGLGLAFKKVAERAKEEKAKKEAEAKK